MISWIQKYFQHHFRTIFAVLLGVLIISFVFTIGAAPGIGQGDRRYVEREFFGYNLSMAEDQQRLMGDAGLSASLQMGMLGGVDNEQIQQYAFHRAASLHLATELKVPGATQAEITDAIKKLRMFSGPNGEFDAKAYDTFRSNLKKNQAGYTEADIARVIGDDVRVEKVNKLIAGPGYVLPREVKAQLERAETTWTLATATTDYAAFKPEIKPTDAELTKYFEDNGPRYEIPPRIVASHVEFPAAQFADRVNVTDTDVRAYYDSNPARFPKPAEATPATPVAPAPTPTNPDADFAAVRPQVEAALRLEQARKLALNAASDFALAVFNSRAKDEAAIERVVSSKNLQQKPLAPFTREEGPAELGRSPEVADAAFGLNKDRLVSDALSTPAGAVVLIWKDLQPARKPLLAEVRERVVADYVENERRKRFVELGRMAKAQLENRLKAGDSFEKAAAAASSSTGLKLEAKTIAPFSMRNRPQDLDYSIFGALESIDKGQVSDMVVTADKGLFVYAQDKQVPAISEVDPKFAEARTQLASFSSRITGSSFLSEIVDRELKRTEPKAQ